MQILIFPSFGHDFSPQPSGSYSEGQELNRECSEQHVVKRQMWSSIVKTDLKSGEQGPQCLADRPWYHGPHLHGDEQKKLWKPNSFCVELNVCFTTTVWPLPLLPSKTRLFKVENIFTRTFRLVIAGKLLIFLCVALSHSRFCEHEWVFQVHWKI